MRILNYLIIVGSISLFACGESMVVHTESVWHKDTIRSIWDEPIRDNLSFTDLISERNYYPIPSQEDFLIGKVSKLIVEDSLFIVLDNRITQSVFVFSKSGKRLLQLHKQGSGPDEYVNLSDVFYDRAKQEICIFCNVSRKLLYYTLSGNFLRSRKIPYSAISVGKIEGSVAFCFEYYDNKQLKHDGALPNVVLCDTLLYGVKDEANYYPPQVKQHIVWSSNASFSSWNGTLSIKPDHHNVVYHITGDSICPAYLLDFGEYGIDYRYWSKVKERNVTLEKVDTYCQGLGMCETFRHLESADYLYFIYRRGKKQYQVLYSKRTKKKLVFEFLKNDMDDLTIFYPYTISGNKVYCLLNTQSLFQFKKTLQDPISKELANNVKEADNPIIVEFTLKDF